MRMLYSMCPAREDSGSRKTGQEPDSAWSVMVLKALEPESWHRAFHQLQAKFGQIPSRQAMGWNHRAIGWYQSQRAHGGRQCGIGFQAALGRNQEQPAKPDVLRGVQPTNALPEIARGTDPFARSPVKGRRVLGKHIMSFQGFLGVWNHCWHLQGKHVSFRWVS